jgi:hypothetical protein
MTKLRDGYMYKKQNRNAFRYQDSFSVNQVGDGFFDSIKNIFSKGKDAIFGDIGTTLSNLVPDSDSTARPLYPGEVHTLLKLPNGKMGRSNMMGPGTHIIDRIKRGDPPRTLSDKESFAHDLRYGFAKNAGDVRVADNKMISKMKQIRADKSDSPFNTTQGLRLIQAKKEIENLTGKPLVSFGGIPPADRKLAKDKLNELKQEGFGSQKPPGELLRKKLLRQLKGQGVSKKKEYKNYHKQAEHNIQSGKGEKSLLDSKMSKMLLNSVKLHCMKHV